MNEMAMDVHVAMTSAMNGNYDMIKVVGIKPIQPAMVIFDLHFPTSSAE